MKKIDKKTLKVKSIRSLDKSKQPKVNINYRIDKSDNDLLLQYCKLFKKTKTELLKIALKNLLLDITESKPKQ